MGTVRRDGDWRLEKRRDGVYEITFRREPQEKILTSDASQGTRSQLMFDTIPLQRVSSYSEAEGLFEEKAHGPPPLGMGYSSSRNGGQGNPDLGDEVNLSDLPPGGIALVFLIAGSLLTYALWDAGTRFGLILGIGFFGVGILILFYGAYLFRAEGWREAWNFLLTADDKQTTSKASSADSATKKTPPAPESLKNELFFERAERHCEYCEEPVDQPDVHHIIPRKDGGPNDRDNLIVLCPNCHRKADNGVISKSKLRYRLKNR